MSTLLQNIDKRIYYTYHSRKNKEMLPTVIMFSGIALIFNHRFQWELIIWVGYLWWTIYNDSKLQKDPENLKERAFLLDLKKKILSGEIKLTKHIN